jgi:hypothetical protein
MLALRVIGAALALAFFAVSVGRYQRRQISRLSLIFSTAIALGVVVLALVPDVFNPIFETFNFEAGTGQRLTAVLLVAVVVLFLLLIRMQSYVDTNERGIRLLVESLGESGFDWDRARDLPEGKRIVVISPAYDEAENIGAVIHAMPEQVEGYHVVPIVVDDCSEDGTADVARAAGPSRRACRSAGAAASRSASATGSR